MCTAVKFKRGDRASVFFASSTIWTQARGEHTQHPGTRKHTQHATTHPHRHTRTHDTHSQPGHTILSTLQIRHTRRNIQADSFSASMYHLDHFKELVTHVARGAHVPKESNCSLQSRLFTTGSLCQSSPSQLCSPDVVIISVTASPITTHLCS